MSALAENVQGRGLTNKIGTQSSRDADFNPADPATSDGQASCGPKEEPMEANVPAVALPHQNADVSCSDVEDPNSIQQQTRPAPSASSDASSMLDPDGALNRGAAIDKPGEKMEGTRTDHAAASGASSARGFDACSIVRNRIGSPYHSRSCSCSCIDDASLIRRASSLPITRQNLDNESVGASSRRAHSLPFSAVHSLNSADEAAALPASGAEDDEICIRVPDIVYSALECDNNAEA